MEENTNEISNFNIKYTFEESFSENKKKIISDIVIGVVLIICFFICNMFFNIPFKFLFFIIVGLLLYLLGDIFVILDMCYDIRAINDILYIKKIFGSEVIPIKKIILVKHCSDISGDKDLDNYDSYGYQVFHRHYLKILYKDNYGRKRKIKILYDFFAKGNGLAFSYSIKGREPYELERCLSNINMQEGFNYERRVRETEDKQIIQLAIAIGVVLIIGIIYRLYLDFIR